MHCTTANRRVKHSNFEMHLSQLFKQTNKRIAPYYEVAI